MKPLAKLIFALTAVAALSFAYPAKALSLDDQRVVGTISPGLSSPQGFQIIASWINYMTTLGLGNQGNIGSQTVARSNNAFANLPNANPNVFATGTSTSINLGAGGVYTYLFAQYRFLGSATTSVVWNVAGLTGNITIPFLNGITTLSSWILFGANSQGVPDGGATVMLLGAALGALGTARRFLKG